MKLTPQRSQREKNIPGRKKNLKEFKGFYELKENGNRENGMR